MEGERDLKHNRRVGVCGSVYSRRYTCSLAFCSPPWYKVHKLESVFQEPPEMKSKILFVWAFLEKVDQHLLIRISNGLITPKLLRTTVLVIYRKKRKESKRDVIKRKKIVS